MLSISAKDGRRNVRGSGAALLAAVTASVFVLASAGAAHATVRIAAHSDPASDPTEFLYRIQPPPPMAPIEFALHDGESHGFGPFEGTLTVQALGPPSWQVVDIQCVGPRPDAFAIDLAHEAVTMQHQRTDEQTCSFTHRPWPASGTPPSGPTSEPNTGQGIAPWPPPAELRTIKLPRRPALMMVRGGRGFVVVAVRLTKLAVVKAQLWSHGRVVGTARVVQGPGIHYLTPRLDQRTIRTLHRRGAKRITVALRVVVVNRPGKTYIFRYGARMHVP